MQIRIPYIFASITFYFILLFFITSCFSQKKEECTIGVAAGKATSDGRPLIWKSRDLSNLTANEVNFNNSYNYQFVTVTNANATGARMGVNLKGFAVVNSDSHDLQGSSSGLTGGSLNRLALGTCATILEFEHLLDSTNVTGRQTEGNFAVLDATGAAALFEIDGTKYWKFDANDSTVAPNGYVLRTNFAFNGGGNTNIEQYQRTVKLIGDFYIGDSLNYKSLLRYHIRDFSDKSSDPVPVPFPNKWFNYTAYGYIRTNDCICRSITVSAAVIQGVLVEEEPKLSTLWAMPGQPASTIAVPYWPVGVTPPEANGSETAPLEDIANQIKSLLFDYEFDNYIDSYKLRDEQGNGLWALTFPAEDSIFNATNEKLKDWRITLPTSQEMINTEYALANYALITLQQAYDGLVTFIEVDNEKLTPTEFVLSQNYPNPFNPSTSIKFKIRNEGKVQLKIYSIRGEEVATIIDNSMRAGFHHITFDGSNLSSGIYFYKLSVNGFIAIKKMLLLK